MNKAEVLEKLRDEFIEFLVLHDVGENDLISQLEYIEKFKTQVNDPPNDRDIIKIQMCDIMIKQLFKRFADNPSKYATKDEN